MPDGKQIITDTKVPLAACPEATETQDDAGREALLARHAPQIRMPAVASCRSNSKFGSRCGF